MPDIPVSLALSEYDHVRDLLDGTVRVPGASLTVLRMPVEEIFYRFTFHREWDVSEMSFAKVVALLAAGDDRLVPIPVFVSRMFRHSSIYVRADAGIARAGDLAGRRVGVPEWAQTAAVYSRGMLQHDQGVDLRGIRWVQAGVNEAGRVEKVALSLPEGLSLTPVPDRSLSEMLLAGDLDAILSARPPAPFAAGDPRIARLFPDFETEEAAWFRRTAVFPIMHVVVIRRDVHERHRWLAMNLMAAFEQAKRHSLARLSEITLSYIPLPWMAERHREQRALFGEDPWPYGVEANLPTLEAFTRWAFEQGVAAKKLDPFEIFAPETRTRFRV
jgi:4,5-dihydroxyphthalate decarboxylase